MMLIRSVDWLNIKVFLIEALSTLDYFIYTPINDP